MIAGGTFAVALTPTEANAFSAFLRETDLWEGHVKLHAELRIREMLIASGERRKSPNKAWREEHHNQYLRLTRLHLQEDKALAKLAEAWCEGELVKMRAPGHHCQICNEELLSPEAWSYPDGLELCQECRDQYEAKIEAKLVAMRAGVGEVPSATSIHDLMVQRIAEFNAGYPVGTLVDYFDGKGGDPVRTKTMAGAFLVDVPLVDIDGVRHAVSLDTVVVVNDDKIEEVKPEEGDTVLCFGCKKHLPPDGLETPNSRLNWCDECTAQQEVVDAWNAEHPVGTALTWRGNRTSITICKAFICNGVPMVKFHLVPGAALLSECVVEIDAEDEPEKETADVDG